MLTRVVASEFSRPASNGRTGPLVLVCEKPDGNTVEVMAKFTVGCDQGVANLTREAVAACLAAEDIFPDLKRTAFTSSMRAVEQGVKKVAKECADTSLLSREVDAGALARMALPADDSSLQWSPVGGGLTDNVEKTFDRLYERLVARCDTHSTHRRTDDDVWRPVREMIAERNIAVQLVKKTIVGTTDEIAFERAWKNGQWHAYEPISLDLADADGIKDKARKWRCHLEAVHDGVSEQVKLHLVVGAPRDPSLIQAYEGAVKILGSSPFQPSIYREDQVDELVDQIEDEVRAHAAANQ